MTRVSSSQSARAVLVVASLAFVAQLLAQTDPLPSWNEGPAKNAIVGFVEVTTTKVARTSYPPQNASQRSTKTARCGSNIRCTRR